MPRYFEKSWPTSFSVKKDFTVADIRKAILDVPDDFVIVMVIPDFGENKPQEIGVSFKQKECIFVLPPL